MEQTLLLPKVSLLFKDELEERRLQNLLDRLSQGNCLWSEFGDLLGASRLTASKDLRTLLHLAVLDHRLDVISLLKNESLLKSKRDCFGLNPIDLAKLLGFKQAVELLEPSSQPPLIDLPQMDFFEYLSYPVYETRAGFEDVIATVAKAKRGDKIPSEKIWMGVYFDKEIAKGLHVPVQIRYINSEIGFGVFALKTISSCAFVGEYSGIIRQKTPKQLKEKKHALRYIIWEGRRNYCIDAEEKGNFTRFINHSAKPNLSLISVYWRGVPRMIFIALKEIREGSQLTFDYGPLFWRHNPQIPIELGDDL